MIPLTYNMALFSKTFQNGDMQIKYGLIGQLNIISGNGTGILPNYSVLPFSGRPTLGFSFLPIHFRNSDKLGVYCDIYRGNQIHKDFYNQSEFEMPGSSVLKFGFKYQFH